MKPRPSPNGAMGTKDTLRHDSVQTIVDHKICCGCGACVTVCPVDCIELIYGWRYNYPVIDAGRCLGCGRCLRVCPSEFLLHGVDPGFRDDPTQTYLDCWLVHARDEQIRHEGASGGGITALLDHLMGTGTINGAVVARTHPQRPLVSQTFVARDRESLLSAQGARYTPVSNCIALREIMKKPGRYAIVGTPCMNQAIALAQDLLPLLRERIVLKVAMVCSGMASRQSTRAYLLHAGVNLSEICDIRYRGDGWPGSFRAFGKNGLLLKRPYIGDVSRHLMPVDRCLRCWNCLDHWGYFADIVASDPWSQELMEHERQGLTAMMVRTDRGRQAIDSAADAGALIVDRLTAHEMLTYNRHLVLSPEHPRHS